MNVQIDADGNVLNVFKAELTKTVGYGMDEKMVASILK